MPKLPEWQRLRHQHSSADMTVPNLVIRRASLVQGAGDLLGRKVPAGRLQMLSNPRYNLQWDFQPQVFQRQLLRDLRRKITIIYAYQRPSDKDAYQITC